MKKDTQNTHVKNGKIQLYTEEITIAKQTQEIMEKNRHDFKSKNKEYVKKSKELFHLLTYLDIENNLENTKKIIPHERGDFLVNINGKEIIYEITTVFGDLESKEIEDSIKNILGIDDKSYDEIDSYPKMDTEKLRELFKKMLAQKKEKDYFSGSRQAILLLVTSEHDRCGTVPWYLAEKIQENVWDFINTTQSSIKILNYFSSGKDNNPETSNIETDVQLYNKIFQSDI